MKKSGNVTFYAIAKLCLAGFGLMMLIITAASTFAFGLFTVITEGVESIGAFSMMALSWNAGLMFLLLIPMLVNVILVLLGKEPLAWPARLHMRASGVALLLWPLLFWVGTFLAERVDLAWALLPPLQTLLVFIPLWWLIETGLRLLKMKHTHTEWSVIGVSMLVTPSLMVFIEVLAFGLALVGFLVWAATRPEIMAELQQFGLRIANAPMDDPEVLDRILMPYLQKPGVITGALFMVSGVIPFIEEIFKPLALWFLIPRRLTPREGFAMGMVSGAVFALIESLGNLINPLADMWSTVMIGRLGTGLLHTLTSALVGWGIASAWTHRRVLRLFLAYLGAVALHAVWNSFALVMGFSPLVVPSAGSGLSEVYTQGAKFAPYVLAVLSALMLFLLISRSYKLGQEAVGEFSAASTEGDMEEENERINLDI